jgi:hypothetical protein
MTGMVDEDCVAATCRSAPVTALLDPVAGIEQRRIRVAELEGVI